MADAALILEGGGMRGVYTAGVLDCLMERELYPPSVYGVSAGACHACSYLSRQKGRAARTVIDYAGDWRYASFRSFLLTGDFFGVQMVYHDIPDRLLPYDYDAFLQKKETLWAAVTNCRTGEAEYLEVEDMRRDIVIIQASSSLPLLSRPVKLDGTPYLDGGLTDSIPLAKAIADGSRRNIVILTQHRGFEKQPSSAMKLMRRKYRAWPNLIHAIETRHIRYNQALELVYEEERAGRAFVIQPRDPVNIDRLEKNKEKLQALYQQGYQDARERMPALLDFWGGASSPS